MKTKKRTVVWSRVLGMMFAMLASFTTLEASDLVEVLPVHDKLIMLHFDDGTIDFHHAGESIYSDRAVVKPLKVEALASSRFTLSSADDARYGEGKAPTTLGRKSKGTEFAESDENWINYFGFKPSVPYAAQEHWIYLELTDALTTGATYTVSWSASELNTTGGSATLLFDPAVARSESVHVNLVGYVPSAAQKFGYLYHWAGDRAGVDFTRWEGQPFHLVRVGDGGISFTGLVAFRRAATNQETAQTDTPNQNFLGSAVWECDFSAFQTEGDYRLVIPGVGCSWPFSIEADVYRAPFKATMHGLFQNRSGIVLESPYAEEYRPAPHNPRPVSEGGTPGFQHRLKYSSTRFYDIKSDGGGEADRLAVEAGYKGNLTATWGWYQDAGDWDGYISHLEIPAQLLLLYQLYPQKFADGELNIPESGNGIPDVVDEGSWLPRFFYRQRVELLSKGWGTGGVGARVFGDLWGYDRPGGIGRGSWQDVDRDWYVTGEDPFSTFRYAANAAQLAEIMQGLGQPDPDGVDWETEAEASYAWAKAHTLPSDETANVHGRLKEHRALAAAALYRLTGEADFHAQLKSDLADVSATESDLSRTRVVAAVLYLGMGSDRATDAELVTRLRSALRTTALFYTTNSADRRATRWGGNFHLPMLIGQPTTPLIEPAVLAYPVLRNFDPAAATEVRRVAYTTADYFLGTNPLNTTWITGLGERSPTAVFCMDDFYTGPAVRRGVTPYGPWYFPNAWTYLRTAGSVWWERDTTYPSIDPRGPGQPDASAAGPGTWPGHEAWFSNRNVPQTSEFTIWQNNLPNAVTYGFLMDELPTLPRITALSPNAQVVAGTDAVLRVTATSRGTLGYQWRRDGLAIPGANAAQLSLTAVQLPDAGAYDVVVTGPGGVVISSQISIAVVSLTDHAATRAVNLSTRARTGAGGELLVPGFVIEGSGSRALLIRAVGPRLQDFGVTGALEDPVLELIRTDGGNASVAMSDDWWSEGNATQIAQMAATVGAFPLDGRTTGGSLDRFSSAVLVDLPAGAYTALCRGKTAASGVALVEIYDLGSPSAARLVNLSNRSYVGQGEEVMVPGIVVAGPTNRSYLIRAAGPALADFGVANTLADPQLEVRSAAGDRIGTNDNWDDDAVQAPSLKSAFSTVGAFGFTAGAKDAAMLVTLAPGAYTVVCRGAGTSTGVALMEVYEIP